MNFLHVVRRAHLYLGLFLFPWFFIYGLSSVPFAHPSWIRSWYNDATPDWRLRLERPYSVEITADTDLRDLGARMLRDTGVAEGAFGTYRHPDGRLETYRYDFRGATRVIYIPDQHRITVEDNRFRWDHFLTGVHARGGFEQSGVLQNLWGALVDVVCTGMLLWILSGLVMWWKIPGHRTWGWVALASGTAAFAAFLAGL